jgi:hypothetical protein
VIEDLIRILDTSYIPDTMNTLRPMIVPVYNTEASRILEVLQSVYEAQLTAGRTRSQPSIPEGVPPQVATALREIRAAASRPLLTMEIDELTNSIVVFAAAQLGQEVAELIRQLDDNAAENASRRVNIIALQRLNTTRLQQALDVLSRETSGRWPSRRRR